MNELRRLIDNVSQGVDRAKAGDALQAYSLIAPEHDAGNLPHATHYGFGWIIYYALHQSEREEIENRKQLLARYLKLEVTRPHKLHSMVLTEAIRLRRDAVELAFVNKNRKDPKFSILSFASLWGWGNLREGDWRRKEFQGKTMGSTAEKLISLCVGELTDGNVQCPEDLSFAIDKGLGLYPNACTLLSQKAAVCMHSGRKGDARELLRKALLVAPGKFYLWSRLAAAVDGAGEGKLRVALLSKALAAPGQPQFKGKVRLALAEAWLELGARGPALWELQEFRKIYEANNWNLPSAFGRAMARIPEDTVSVDPSPAYKRVEHLADNELRNSLPSLTASKTYHKPTRPGAPGNPRPQPTDWRVTDDAGNHFWIQPHRFGIDPSLPLGTRLKLWVHGSRPVGAELADDNS